MYQIKETCSGCHQCELACPMQAVSYDGSKYAIDSDLCVECGLCEKLCPTCSIYDEDDHTKPEPHGKIIRECDLVVCGGGSGLIAAIKAGQSGKKVILLEKAKRVGGNMSLARAIYPAYSKLHAELGLSDVREDEAKRLSARTGGKIGSDIMRTAIYGCAEFADWFLEFPGARSRLSLELLGEKCTEEASYGASALSVSERIENKLSKDPSIGPGLVGSLVKKILLDAIPEQKLDVEILLEHEARHLITNDTGGITGVIATDPGGETEIHSKAVVLATGGYGASSEKLRKYSAFPDGERHVRHITVPSNTGDAIDMLLELGVCPNPEHMFVSILGPTHRPFSYSLCRVFEHPTALLVSLKGRRWKDESIGHSDRAKKIAGSPGETAWGIFTQKNIDGIMQICLNDLPSAGEKALCEYYQEDLDRESGYRKPPVYKADTIEALAKKLDIDASALKETVENYNSYCRNGSDEEFGKNPEFLVPRETGPYYAIYGQLFSEISAGGLAVDAKCRVLRSDNTPVPGLYAAGDATSAIYRRSETPAVSGLTWAAASAFRSAVESSEEMEGSV